MTSLKIILLSFWQFLITFPNHAILLFANFVTLIFIICIMMYRVSRSHKIENFMLNKIFIGIFVIYYVIFLLLIRILFIGQSYDLNKTYAMVNYLWHQSFLAFIEVLLIAVVIFCLLLRLRSFLVKEVRKYYLFFQFTYIYLYRWLSYRLLLIDYHQWIISFFHIVLKDRYDIYNVINSKWLFQFEKLFPLVSCLLLILWDCLYNNFVLSKIFYILPFVIIYHLWISVLTLCRYDSELLNEIFYERYYCEDKIIYNNTTTAEDDFLRLILQFNLMAPFYFKRFNREEYVRAVESTSQWVINFKTQRRYTFFREEGENIIFENPYFEWPLQEVVLGEGDLPEDAEWLYDFQRTFYRGSTITMTKKSYGEFKRLKSTDDDPITTNFSSIIKEAS